MTDDKDKAKSKSFQSISDILKIDGSAGFDETLGEKELAELEARKKQVEEYKNTLKSLSEEKNNDTYMDKVLKSMVEKGMVILDSLQREIEDCPRGRDVETAATMISALNTVIASINNIKVDNAKIAIEQEKLIIKKSGLAALPGGGSGDTTNIIVQANMNEMLDMILNRKTTEIKTVDVENIKDS